MKTNSNNGESKEVSQQDQTQKGSAGYGAAEETEQKKETTDDFGYEKAESTEEKKETSEEPKKVESTEEKKETSEEEKKVENPSTGYGDEAPEVKEEKKEQTPEEKDVETKRHEEIAEALKDFDENFDKEKIRKFAQENGMTQAQVKAYAKFAKEESAAAQARMKQEVAKQRNDWFNELKNDKDFGGENFRKNVDRVEKVLEKSMPNTKKILTERGTMLPPYLMRDLLALSKALNPTTKFVEGESVEAGKKGNDNFLDDFYN